MSYLSKLANSVQKQKTNSLALTTVRNKLETEFAGGGQWGLIKTLMTTQSNYALQLLNFAVEGNVYAATLVTNRLNIFLNGALVEHCDPKVFCGDVGKALIEKINFISLLVDTLVKRHDMNECFDIDISRLSIKTLYEDSISHVICVSEEASWDEPGVDIVRTILGGENYSVSRY